MATDDIERDALDADAARLTEAIVEAVRPSIRDLARRALDASFRGGVRHALRPLQAALAALEPDGADDLASVEDGLVPPSAAADAPDAQPADVPASAAADPARTASVPAVAARARMRTDARQAPGDVVDVPADAIDARAEAAGGPDAQLPDVPAQVPADPVPEDARQAQAGAAVRELALGFLGDHPEGASVATVAAHCREVRHGTTTGAVRKALARLGGRGVVRRDDHQLWRAV